MGRLRGPGLGPGLGLWPTLTVFLVHGRGTEDASRSGHRDAARVSPAARDDRHRPTATATAIATSAISASSAGNTHDSEGLKPMVEGHQTRHDPHNGRYFKPQRLHADKAYDRADLRR